MKIDSISNQATNMGYFGVYKPLSPWPTNMRCDPSDTYNMTIDPRMRVALFRASSGTLLRLSLALQVSKDGDLIHSGGSSPVHALGSKPTLAFPSC